MSILFTYHQEASADCTSNRIISRAQQVTNNPKGVEEQEVAAAEEVKRSPRRLIASWDETRTKTWHRALAQSCDLTAARLTDNWSTKLLDGVRWGRKPYSDRSGLDWTTLNTPLISDCLFPGARAFLTGLRRKIPVFHTFSSSISNLRFMMGWLISLWLFGGGGGFNILIKLR